MNRWMLGATLCAAMFCAAISVSGVLGQEAPPPDPDKTTTAGEPERVVSARIDSEVAKVWERDGIKPAAVSSDEEFVRRVYLDTTGAPPTADEVVAFCADKEKDKRRTLIAKLVDDPRFGRHVADLWTNILLGRSGRDYGGSNHLLAIWLAERVNKGDKFSDIMYDLVTAQGSLSENPAVAIYVREVPFRVANSAGTVTKNLTGVQIQCAECHDHPYETAWKQTTFDGVASFWSPIQVRLNIRNVPVDPSVADQPRGPAPLPKGAEDRLPAEVREARLLATRYNKPVTIDGTAVKTDNRKLWRPAMAKWLIADENKQTARYMANRFWSFTFGIGLQNPVDDFNSLNEASHPELLEYLAQALIDSDYDIKRLYRAILNSNTWQLSSKDGPEKAEGWHFASAAARQMSAEQFFGSFLQIAGGDELVRGMRSRNGSPADQLTRRYKQRTREVEKGDNMREYTFDEDALNRFIGWYDKMEDGWFLRRSMAQGYSLVGTDDEMVDADGFSLTIDQALLVMNGEVTSALSGSKRGTLIWKLQNELKSDDDRLDRLYLTVLSRKPDRDESVAMKKYLKEMKNSTEAWEDIMFALLASSEFSTNH